MPFATAQAAFAQAGQMLALDPPLGADASATIGGVVATADSGPLRHRYGAPRDLVIGMTVALADGTIAKSGGKVIKNVAGYDLAKLLRGLVRHAGPDPVGQRAPASAASRAHDRRSARPMTPTRSPPPRWRWPRMPLEFDALDVAWRGRPGRNPDALRGT